MAAARTRLPVSLLRHSPPAARRLRSAHKVRGAIPPRQVCRPRELYTFPSSLDASMNVIIAQDSLMLSKYQNRPLRQPDVETAVGLDNQVREVVARVVPTAVLGRL